MRIKRLWSKNADEFAQYVTATPERIIQDIRHLLHGNIGDSLLRYELLVRLAKFPRQPKIEAWLFIRLAQHAYKVTSTDAINIFKHLTPESRKRIGEAIVEDVVQAKDLFPEDIANRAIYLARAREESQKRQLV